MLCSITELQVAIYTQTEAIVSVPASFLKGRKLEEGEGARECQKYIRVCRVPRRKASKLYEKGYVGTKS